MNPKIVAIWPSFSREVRTLGGGPEQDCAARREHWLARGRSTAAAELLVGQALECEDLAEAVREDLRWLLSRMEVGREFCALVAETWEALALPSDAAETVAHSWAGLAARLRDEAGSDFVDPLGGDVMAAIEIAKAFGAVLREGYSPS